MLKEEVNAYLKRITKRKWPAIAKLEAHFFVIMLNFIEETNQKGENIDRVWLEKKIKEIDDREKNGGEM